MIREFHFQQKLRMYAVAAALVGLVLLSAATKAQQCNFRCTCADPAEYFVTCPKLNADQCAQAAKRASVGGVICTGSMVAVCQADKQIAPPPGSYGQSCDGCEHDCTFLLCNCRRADGTASQTGINYAACPGHSVANANGMLACGR